MTNKGDYPIFEIDLKDMDYSREEHISEIRNSLLSKVMEIKDNFKDFKHRQIALFDLKRLFESAKRDFMGELPLFELIICLFYAVKNSCHGDITDEQIDALQAAISKVDCGLTESDVDKIVEELITAGFNPLPKLDGLAEIYERQGEI